MLPFDNANEMQVVIDMTEGTTLGLVDIQENIRDKSIYRKNQKRVVYVLADMAGKLESPVYAILGDDW